MAFFPAFLNGRSQIFEIRELDELSIGFDPFQLLHIFFFNRAQYIRIDLYHRFHHALHPVYSIPLDLQIIQNGDNRSQFHFDHHFCPINSLTISDLKIAEKFL